MRLDRNARAAEQRLAQIARAHGLALTSIMRGGHSIARQLRDARKLGHRQRGRRARSIGKLAATRATTSGGARAKLLFALVAFEMDEHAMSLVRSAARDLKGRPAG